MTDPARLRESGGAASQLMRGSHLAVPRAARRRALAFTAAAVNLAGGGTAFAAGSVSLVKSVALYVTVGVVGGGLASLGVSSALTSWEQPRSAAPAITASPHPAPGLAKPAPAPSAIAEVPAAPDPATPVISAEAEPPAATKELAPIRGALPVASSAAQSRPRLFDEQREIERARAAIARGDYSRGLQVLKSYDRAFPRGQFHPEALALRVEALSGRGDFSRARALADDFARRYPQHPLLARVQASAGRK
ncbi:MAG: outer membrane protein assembly factor BamD [Myxococcales bacterium]|nr:MAG: outer membrane protein assembly factor BamD [Myxococcales bacterium]